MNLEELLESLPEDSQIVWYDQDGNAKPELASNIEGLLDQYMPSNNEWIETVDGDYFPAKNTKIKKKLPPGSYSIHTSQGKYFCSKVEPSTDDLYRMPNNKIEEILVEMDRFWDKAELFAEEGITHKRGIMFHGGPGCGKTSTISILETDVIKRGGIVFRIATINDLRAMIEFVHDYFRDIQPETPVVVVMEDIDSLVNASESIVLNYLNGADEFDHCINIATTNRIHECNDLLLRESRFDYIIELEPPNEEERRFYLSKKKLDEETLEKWVLASKGFSMAQLKELYIAVKLLDNDFDAVILKIGDHEKNVKISTFKPIKTTIGFGGQKK